MFTTKKRFFVMLAVMVLFSFTSSISASDVKDVSDKIKDTTEDVKSEIKSDIKQPDLKIGEEVDKAKADITAVKKININKANAIELSSVLKRVGPKYAAAIVEYREKNGEFQSPEDIKKVKGIGEKIYELNKDIIAVKD